MKKILLFVTVVTAASFASCKKDRTCTCTTTYSNGSPSDTHVATLTDARKGDAKKMCISSTYVDSGVTATETCKLK
jgi:hypothetical protein